MFSDVLPEGVKRNFYTAIRCRSAIWNFWCANMLSSKIATAIAAELLSTFHGRLYLKTRFLFISIVRWLDIFLQLRFIVY